MGTILAYSLTVSLILMFAYGGYRLSRNVSPRLRRTILLATYAIALVVIPALLHLNLATASAPASTVTPAAAAATATLPEMTATTPDAAPPTSIFGILLRLYIAGASVCLLMTAIHLLRIARLLLTSRKQTADGLTVYVHRRRDISPFSFAGIMVANAADIANPAIIAHEGAHIARRHSIDLAIAQLTAILCWYCPAAWQLRRELKLIHEFQADEAVISAGADTDAYCRLLVRRAAALRIKAIANSFDHNNLKQRIKMMQTPSAGRHRTPLRVLFPMAAIACGAMLLSAPAVSATIAMISRTALQVRGLETKPAAESVFVVYGVDLDSEAVKNGKFESATDFDAKNINFHDIDGVIFPQIGALFCYDRQVLDRLTTDIRKHIVNGKIMSPDEFSAIPASHLCKIIISGNTMQVFTRDHTESQLFDPLEAAVKAEYNLPLLKSRILTNQ